jgi:hypothetical protein
MEVFCLFIVLPPFIDCTAFYRITAIMRAGHNSNSSIIFALLIDCPGRHYDAREGTTCPFD